MNKSFSGSLWGDRPPVNKQPEIPVITYKQALEDIVEYLNNTPFENEDIETLYKRLLNKNVKIKEDSHE